jgi:proteasome lid subunit RPN8/RPN11/phage shock protein PspC (stress-responsive transcriptional regulator)
MPLYRSRRNRVLAGVCGGFAEWLGWNPTGVRVLYVVLSLCSAAFPGILVYVLSCRRRKAEWRPRGRLGRVTLILPTALRRQVVAHAREVEPEECCGILLGHLEGDGEAARVEEVVATRNAARDRRRRYVVPPSDVVAAERRVREEGRSVVGYYHSHPADPATPSARDRKTAWRGVRYLIVSLAREGRPELRSFLLREDGRDFAEEPCRDARSGRRFHA